MKEEVWSFLEKESSLKIIERAVKSCNVYYDFDDLYHDTLMKVQEKLVDKPYKLDYCRNNINYLKSMAKGTCKDLMEKKKKKEEKEIPSSPFLDFREVVAI